MAEFALNEQGATKLATIHDESPYTQGLTAAAAVNFEAGDGTVTVQEQINSEDTDFKPLLRSIAEGDPDVLYAPVFVAACSLILKQAADIMPDVTIMASDGCMSTRHAEERRRRRRRRLPVLAGHLGVPGRRLLLERVHPRLRGAVRLRADVGVPRARVRRGERAVRRDRAGGGGERRRIAVDPADGAAGRGVRHVGLRGAHRHHHVHRAG